MFAPELLTGATRAAGDNLCSQYIAALAAVTSPTQPTFSPAPNATFEYNTGAYTYSGSNRLHKAPARVVSSILQTGTNTFDDVRLESVAYIDGNGRTRETQTKSPTSGKIIVTGGYTDSRGLPSVTVDTFAITDNTTVPGSTAGDTLSPPSNGAKGFSTWPTLPSTGVRTTAVVYDNNSRPLTTTITYPAVAGAASYTASSSTAYFGATTINTSPFGAMQATKVDAHGRTIEVHVFGGSGGSTAPTTQSLSNPGAITKYRYTYPDLAALVPPEPKTYGQLTTAVTDDNLNVTTTITNLSGQTVESNDPNAGTSKFEYDKNGNIIKTIDAAGTVIKTTYDALNRPLQRWSGDIEWPTTTTDPARLASWTYDGATRGKGMAWTEDFSPNVIKAIGGAEVLGS